MWISLAIFLILIWAIFWLYKESQHSGIEGAVAGFFMQAFVFLIAYLYYIIMSFLYFRVIDLIFVGVMTIFWIGFIIIMGIRDRKWAREEREYREKYYGKGDK